MKAKIIYNEISTLHINFVNLIGNMKNLFLDDIVGNPTSVIYQSTYDLIKSLGVQPNLAHVFTSFSLLLGAFVLFLIINQILKAVFHSLVFKIIKGSKTHWDDYLLENKVNEHLSRLILIVISQQSFPLLFLGFSTLMEILSKFLTVLLIIATYSLINSLLKTGRDIAKTTKAFKDKPLDSYLQVVQIFLFFLGGTLVFSLLTGNSPWSFLVSLGAASAILMLVFKDTILGFVASIQVSANDSVRVGDWIEMPKYGVDGDVIQINLNNVRVQNWDKTIVTIPTHTLLSDSFKNYRGMQDSGGRRIKRALHIKISSIRYLDTQEINELRRISLLASFIDKRENEINSYNLNNNIDQEMLVNGRRMTNAGLFRAYVQAYCQNNPKIHKGLTLMVRQLEPTDKGLPLELYMFTSGTQWAFYEETMADLFDHLFAAIKYFHLEIFELPASSDLRIIKDKVTLSKISTFN
ncbi:mechanosensitive ion channel family protein [Sphingobacterium humi]|uniref:Mechanosensitive ion channel n=1 Tax=Sphingobacterium humi TaxID=1796905 RepID=A0A6N8L608_9SPHI|nr:mechanosensitive ion channel domain-containing protein [Sphingobacterium humi]MVZ63608.1 mechanosensitive ion channel [Sphingobacterium humi]